MEKQGIILRAREELEEARKNAWSIGAYNTPKGSAEYLGSLSENNDIFHFYRDAEKKYYYESERGLKFDREMRKAQKRHREKKRRERHYEIF